ncbi:MAG: contractile injection system tape measure protein, partial [Bacteroidota bacterium]
GMQKKQLQQSDFANELAANLVEEDIQHVIGYVEPEYKLSILYFVEAAVSVVEIQSLTDKITSFKKQLYAFVLSYLLLKKGYSFYKKQFVAQQLQQLARHFGMEYNAIVYVFLETLHPDAAFGKEKELYQILLLLRNSIPKTSQTEVTQLPKQKEISTQVQLLSPSVWSVLFVYYLTHEKLPIWTSIADFKTLVDQLPIFNITNTNMRYFLRRQPKIQQFLDDVHVKRQSISIAVLATCILDKKMTKELQHQLKKVIDAKHLQSKDTEMSTEMWTRMLVMYLEVGQLPNWSRIRNVDQLLSLIPVQSLQISTLHTFLRSQQLLTDFMQSTIAKKQQLTFDELVNFIIHKQKKSSTTTHALPAEYWVKILVFYLSNGTFPYWSVIQNVVELQNHLPLQKVTKNKVLDFLASQPLLIQFLQSHLAKHQKIMLDDLVIFITTKYQDLQQKTTTKSQKKQTKFPQISANYWTKMFVYYLENGRFPIWSSIQTISALTAQIPIQKFTVKHIIAFLEAQSAIRIFLNTAKVTHTRISLRELAEFISNPSASNLLQKLHKQHLDGEVSFTTKQQKQTHCLAVFLYYLEHQTLPWWSLYTSTKQLAQEVTFDRKTSRALTKFLQKHKNSKQIWRIVQVLSEDKVFREKLLKFMIPNATSRQAIRSLVSLFAPIRTSDKNTFVAHFGMVSNGAIFWEIVWTSRQLLFIDSQKSFVAFWKKLAKAYAIKFNVFAVATLESIHNKKHLKAAKIWQEIYKTRVSSSANKTGKSVFSEQQIAQLLFQTSVPISPQDLRKLRQEFHKNAHLFFNIFTKRIHNQPFSNSEFVSLYARWSTIVAPSHNKELITFCNEWIHFTASNAQFSSKEMSFFLLFLWESAQKFTFKNLPQYIEQWLIALSQQKRISLQVLCATVYAEIHKKKTVFPQLFRSLVYVQLKQGVSLKDEELGVISQEEKLSKTTTDIGLTQIQLCNAGVVLLWKFLPILFERAQLWNSEDKVFYDEEAKNKAVLLLQYVATGTLQYEDEHELLLMKILCGLPPEFYIEEIDLEDTDISLVESLITAAIAQWKKLGTVSVEGFRNTFLKRSGLLDEDDEKMIITIESTGVDVLLDFLPWTLSTLRLPWLSKRIHVVWRDKSVLN